MRSILNASSVVAITNENHYFGHLLAAEGVHHAVRGFGDLRDDAVVDRVVAHIYDRVVVGHWFRDPSRAWVWLGRNVPRDRVSRAPARVGPQRARRVRHASAALCRSAWQVGHRREDAGARPPWRHAAPVVPGRAHHPHAARPARDLRFRSPPAAAAPRIGAIPPPEQAAGWDVGGAAGADHHCLAGERRPAARQPAAPPGQVSGGALRGPRQPAARPKSSGSAASWASRSRSRCSTGWW